MATAACKNPRTCGIKATSPKHITRPSAPCGPYASSCAPSGKKQCAASIRRSPARWPSRISPCPGTGSSWSRCGNRPSAPITCDRRIEAAHCFFPLGAHDDAYGPQGALGLVICFGEVAFIPQVLGFLQAAVAIHQERVGIRDGRAERFELLLKLDDFLVFMVGHV